MNSVVTVLKINKQSILLLVTAILFSSGCSKKNETTPVAAIAETTVATTELETIIEPDISVEIVIPEITSKEDIEKLDRSSLEKYLDEVLSEEELESYSQFYWNAKTGEARKLSEDENVEMTNGEFLVIFLKEEDVSIPYREGKKAIKAMKTIKGADRKYILVAFEEVGEDTRVSLGKDELNSSIILLGTGIVSTQPSTQSNEELPKGLTFDEWFQTDYFSNHLRNTKDYGIFILWDSEEGYGQIISNKEKISMKKNQKLLFHEISTYNIKALTSETVSGTELFDGTTVKVNIIDSDEEFDVVFEVKDLVNDKISQFEMTIVPK